MQAELVRSFYFEAAHSLPNAPDGHKCRRTHGHSYRVDVHVVGPVDERTGWVMDFGEIDKLVGPVIDALDHRTLNDVPGLADTTAEHIAKYVWDRLAADLPGLASVTVWESERSRCIYRGR